MRTILAALAALFAVTLFADSPNCPVNYGYSGFAPPSQWKYLPDSEACGSSKTQSPVKLQNAKSVLGDGLRFDYHRSSMTLLNSGHDFRLTMPDGVNNLLFLPGETDAGYRLQNFHFHAPNEHVLPGHPFAGEIHLVHDRGGHIAVVAIFIRIGAENKALKAVFDKLPLHLCDSTSIELDPNALLGTAQGNYYTYTGSLTTPHCDEGVQFFIYSNPITISQGQLAKLMTFGRNARPLQENSNPLEYVRVK